MIKRVTDTEIAVRPPFAVSLSCKRCGTVGCRIFEKFKSEEALNHLPAYIFLNWIGCGNKQCKNYFAKPHTLSRCPVCARWSVTLANNEEIQIWQCMNKECEWKLKMVNLEQ